MIKSIFLISILAMLLGCNKKVEGFVYDCETKDPVENAIILSRQTGWGTSNGQIIWDKSYPAQTKTDGHGSFQLFLKLNKSVLIRVKADGYHPAEQYTYPGNNLEIGLLANHGKLDLEVTNNCTLSSKCLDCTTTNGVAECRNICF